MNFETFSMIVFAWDGFPQYAARCVGAFVRTTNERVMVVATRPNVPIEGMEKLCGCPVHWIDGRELFDLRLFDCLIGREGERITLFVTGWKVPAFNRLRDQVRAKGGRIICMLDNNMMGRGLFDFGFRDCLIEIVKVLRFRLTLRKHFDGFIVPGRAGRRLLRFYGVPDGKIFEGFYAADESLFTPGPAIEDRPKKIIYVGQLCERKNVRRLVEAFHESFKVERLKGFKVSRFQGFKVPKFQSRKVSGIQSFRGEGLKGFEDGEWSLELYGSGPLKEELNQTIKQSNNQTIHLHDFLQPEELAAKYREARIFCLPSLEEHWGLVVHEAALSGCALLLSNRVGAKEDFLEEGVNGLSFDPYDVNDMAEKFAEAMTRTFETKTAAERAREMGVKRFVKAVERLKS